MIAADIEWGLEALRKRRGRYVLAQDYYDGRHRLTFATERFRSAFGHLFRAYALNLSATVVDVIADRLTIVGWSAPDNPEASSPEAQALWERELMSVRHGRVHRDVLVQGDAYQSVWQDQAGQVRIYDEDVTQVVGRYTPGDPSRLAYAVKAWCENKRVRVTVYYPDRLERYVTRRDTENIPEKAGFLIPLRPSDVPPGADSRPEVPNPWGVVPMFHWANNAGSDGLGRSELHDVIPPQDALNKSVADLLVTAESHSLPLRYLIGVEEDIDPRTGRSRPLFEEARNRVVTLPKGAEPGQWDPSNLAALIDVKREHAADVSAVSGVPLHLIMGVRNATDWPSGQALRVAESRLTSKAADRRDEWGPTWADMMALALRMYAGETNPVRSLWAPVETPPTDLERAQAMAAKIAAGIPRSQAWREAGYSEAQIVQMEGEADQAAQDAADRQAQMFAAGDPAATGGL